MTSCSCLTVTNRRRKASLAHFAISQVLQLHDQCSMRISNKLRAQYYRRFAAMSVKPKLWGKARIQSTLAYADAHWVPADKRTIQNPKKRKSYHRAPTIGDGPVAPRDASFVQDTVFLSNKPSPEIEAPTLRRAQSRWSFKVQAPHPDLRPTAFEKSIPKCESSSSNIHSDVIMFQIPAITCKILEHYDFLHEIVVSCDK